MVGEGILYLKSVENERKIAIYWDTKKFFARLKDASGNPYSKSVSFVLLPGFEENLSEQYELSKIKKYAKDKGLELENNI